MSENLAGFFSTSEFAVTATWGVLTAPVILDTPDQLLFGGGQQFTDYRMTYAAGNFSGLDAGESVSIGGVSYTVREARAMDDGAIMVATLQKT